MSPSATVSPVVSSMSATVSPSSPSPMWPSASSAAGSVSPSVAVSSVSSSSASSAAGVTLTVNVAAGLVWAGSVVWVMVAVPAATPRICRVCGLCQLLGMKVRTTGVTTAMASSSTVAVTVTSAVGAESSEMLYEVLSPDATDAVAPLSVTAGGSAPTTGGGPPGPGSTDGPGPRGPGPTGRPRSRESRSTDGPGSTT